MTSPRAPEGRGHGGEVKWCPLGGEVKGEVGARSKLILSTGLYTGHSLSVKGRMGK